MKSLEGGLNLDQGLDVNLHVRAAHLHEDLPGCPARKSGEEWQPVTKRRQIPSWFTKAPPGRAGFFTFAAGFATQAPVVTLNCQPCQGQVTIDPTRFLSPSGLPQWIQVLCYEWRDGPIDSEGRTYVAVHRYHDSLARPRINYTGHLYDSSHCSPHSFVSTIMFSQMGF